MTRVIGNLELILSCCDPSFLDLVGCCAYDARHNRISFIFGCIALISVPVDARTDLACADVG